VAEDEDAVSGCWFARAKSEFEDIAEVSLAVTLDSTVEGIGMSGGKIHAGVYGGFVVGWRLGKDKALGEVEELRLLAAGSCEQGANGDGN
jgi:hypothetical protein